MRILITGAAGFVGSHLTDRFLSGGHEVIAVDNLSTGRLSNLAEAIESSHFCFIAQDVVEPLDLIQPVDWVLHFASPASPPKYLKSPIETLRVNAEGTFRMLELARDHGAAFFLASTSEIYGDPKVHPQPETYWGNVNTVGPRSVYDEAKRYAESMTTAFSRAYQVPVRIVRIFNTYGPRMDPEDGRVVTNLIVQGLRAKPFTVYGAGDQTRSFQYVDDLVDGIESLMEVPYSLPVNLGNPEEYTISEFVELVRELTGSSAPIAYEPLPVDDPRQRRPDISKAKELLGWTPRVSVRVGLQRTIEHFRSILDVQPSQTVSHEARNAVGRSASLDAVTETV